MSQYNILPVDKMLTENYTELGENGNRHYISTIPLLSMTIRMLRLQGVICHVLRGKFEVIKSQCKLLLVGMRLTAIQGRFFSFILFFLLLSQPWKELRYFCMGAR